MTRAIVARLAVAAVLALAPLVGVEADVFSPGDLSRAHASLEGLGSCTRCHVAGEQLAPERCLECHAELRARVVEGRGLHGRIAAAERRCERCHHEHQGRDFPLVDWGKPGRRGFDHARTGFELRGKHRRAECARCHDRRLVQEPVIVELIGKQPRRETLLGAPTACAACHFDEHRGQLGADCRRCHDEEGWKPARRFEHARTAYPLEGRHAKVPCAKCHRAEPEPTARAAAPAQTAPASASSFVRYKGLAFQGCAGCHRDPHQGRFGATCQGCHAPDDWKRVAGGGRERAFHEKTRYPLRGAHAAVRCETCHGPFPGVPARFRGLAFERCTDCHADAHAGQLGPAATGAAPAPPVARTSSPGAAAAPPARTCDACHGLDAWTPVRFEEADHARLAYRLEGAHRAVACALCHPKDPRLEAKVSDRQRAELRRRGRTLRVSAALLDVPNAGDCRTCHRDPHARQLDARIAGGGCVVCHEVTSWRRVRFDHAKDSRFPLTGKHEPAACASCHRRDAAGVVRYRPLEPRCAACHADPHAGQLAVSGQGTDCARCHETAGWKAPAPLRFAHAPPFTAFALAGKHERVACDRCHPAVKLANGEARRYRGVPTACEGCHADFHKGAFRLASGEERGTRCARCHVVEGWRRVTFAHDRTRFPLEGRHREAACQGCHADAVFAAPVPRACAACHPDVHQGRLGRRCERCHAATSWRDVAFDADAHRRSAFPLTGRHAAVPCESCHGDARDRGFTRPLSGCVSCHEDALQRAQASAALPHDASLTDCRSCHGTSRFRPAGFPAHDACFAVTRGPHAGVRCRDCHTSVPPAAEPLSCASGSYDCTRCHSCAEHDRVSGFDCNAQRKCYECHRFSSGG